MTEPTTWLVAVTTVDGTEYTDYRNAKDAHRVASDASRAPRADYATVTFNGCVTTYRDGIGTGPGETEPEQPAETLSEPAADREPAEGCKRLTIRHTHEDGTLVYGSEPGDGVYELIGPRTAARFKYMPSIKMIGIRQSRDHLAKRWQIDQAAKALREAGHVVTVEIDDTPRDVADVHADRAERLDNRYDRLSGKAERQSAEARARSAAADRIGERFSGGQPILKGHHSERGARADQKRMDQHDRAANIAYGKAERASRAASVVGREESRRQRPDVIIRRIASTEAELRQTQRYISGEPPPNHASYYPPGYFKPAAGEYLESLTARKTFLEHQLAADREALEAAKAAGYVQLDRDSVHKGDVIGWGSWKGDTATVVRVNPRSVSLDRTSYPRVLPYEQIKSVQCPHDGTEQAITMPKRAPARLKPAVAVAEPPAPREAPLEVDSRFEFFPTPAGVAVRMATIADLYALPGLAVLEPSAGLGAIAKVAASAGATVDCVELCRDLYERLRASGAYRSVRCADFLEVEPEPVYDRVLMNPPFGKGADVRHVMHALRFLKPGGMLAAVMSNGATFREDRATAELRQLVTGSGGYFSELPPDTFKHCGIGVRTVIAVISASAPAAEPEPEPEPEPELVTDASGQLALFA
jgi:predicted RNA methylase